MTPELTFMIGIIISGIILVLLELRVQKKNERKLRTMEEEHRKLLEKAKHAQYPMTPDECFPKDNETNYIAGLPKGFNVNHVEVEYTYLGTDGQEFKQPKCSDQWERK